MYQQTHIKLMQEAGVKVQSYDALFGPCRKKHAGTSVRAPLFGTTFFEKQDEVDAFVQEYDSAASIMTTKVNPMCVLVLKDNSIYSW